MLRWMTLAAFVFGCDEGAASFEPSGTGSSTTKTGSGGFSSDLAKTMGSGAGGSAAGSAKAGSGVAVVPAGSGSSVAAGSGSSAVAAGSAKGSDSPPAGSGSAVVAAGSASKAGSGSAAVAAGSGSAVKAGSASPPPTNGGSAVAIAPPINVNAPRVPIKPSAELAAIKLSLSPNWDRDVGEAGTISLVVKVPGREEVRVFSFRYGYEDSKAPTDREAYKKWLESNKVLTPSVDRQRGAAWYLEGVDGTGAPAFRIIVNYGGKKLICGGLLYKDAASNQLGDIRDKTIIQAKEICESVQL